MFLFLLRFDFVAFKSLSQLTLDGVPCREILTSLGPVRGTLRRLRARRCSLRSVADMLLCDAGGAEAMARLGRSDDTETPSDEDEVKGNTWERLERLDLNDNEITEIDRYEKRIQRNKPNSTFSFNIISTLFQECETSRPPAERPLPCREQHHGDQERGRPGGPKYAGSVEKRGRGETDKEKYWGKDRFYREMLVVLQEAEGLNARLGQLSRLDLAENLLRTLSGFAKLYSLQHLNLVSNRGGLCISCMCLCISAFRSNYTKRSFDDSAVDFLPHLIAKIGLVYPRMASSLYSCVTAQHGQSQEMMASSASSPRMPIRTRTFFLRSATRQTCSGSRTGRKHVVMQDCAPNVHTFSPMLSAAMYMRTHGQ